ncbi:QacE family quaternary ammonium compound efflux SMR transporter [Proteus cibarius]|uniref:Guanidinium exporter n=1 Tax=Proteus terrae subsp. cibarius TaxID=626774 RepID=A0A6G6S8V9_9GAMM|nr:MULTISPECIES: SMR family transporter [Proteus]QHP76735.1 QacE family quaternary ammonium compound efflux SMR transporter [Proteus vulgaris]MBG2913497.1 QacE family quaternary ammonium compound efflux SMR transporter [Proteus terrae subsp. cibarius]MBG3090867.1 QacE family quaternary ammonium compound efflux SMR transporter [Proteus terrae subsp. cibarius]MBG6037189.1 QacE family quaternary ammonium compound efflux SMR transporter [Proteus terrae subsp. cibarius]MCM2366438.1 SMR family trans
MNGLTYLMLAIISEVIATTMLKASDGFSRLYPSIVVVIGYCFSFWALSQVVRVMPLGIAYAIWSGLGIVLVSVAAVFLYQQKLDLPAIVGMTLIIAGVLIINLLSKSASH